MKFSNAIPQITACTLWALVVFYIISSAPMPLAGFPEQESGLIAKRQAYNPSLAAALDTGLRDFWQKPEMVLNLLGDLDGLTVADIGCGEGYFTLRLLERVGPDGHVFANDIQPEMLDALALRIPPEYRDRISLVLGNPDDTGIGEVVDLIFLVQVLGEIPDQPAFLKQIKRLMHADSRLVLIDSKHITDAETGFTRPLNLQKMVDALATEGLVLVDDYRSADFEFLPKQFFFVLELAGETI